MTKTAAPRAYRLTRRHTFVLALFGLLAILSAVITANESLLAAGIFTGTVAVGWAAFTSMVR